MNIDQNIADWLWKIANALATIGVFVYTIFATRDKDNTSYIKAVEETLSKALAAHASRLDKIESRMENLPTAQSFADMRVQVEKIATSQKYIEENLSGIRDTMKSMDEHLRSQGR
jgi:hypothetical protein